MGKKIEREICLDNLPKWEKGTMAREGTIKWEECIGLYIDFKYKQIEGSIEVIEYYKDTQYIKLKYMDNVINMLTGSLLHCKIGRLVGVRDNKFIYEIGNVVSNKLIIIDRKYSNDITSSGYTKVNKYYKFKCSCCGFDSSSHYKNGELFEEYWVLEWGLTKENYCPCCSNKITVPGINSIVDDKNTQWMIPYFQGGYDEAKKYTQNSNKRIYPICPDCGVIKNKDSGICVINRHKSINCICGDGFSRGHKYVHNILKQLEIEFKDNKIMEWCKYPDYKVVSKIITGEYDFVIEYHKLIIEIDGDFHREDNTMNGQTKEHSKYLDDMKDLKARENGYKIIRISDENDIKSNVISKLSPIYDLGSINWDKASEYSMSNLSKIARDMFDKGNGGLSIKDISNVLGVHRSTIVKWLNRWVDLGLCDYDAVESKKESSSKNGKSNGIKVEILKDNISKGVFSSCLELSRLSLEEFGVQLNNSKISAVARGDRQQHQGFTFKYVS